MKRISYDAAFGHCILGPMPETVFESNYAIAEAEAVGEITVETLSDSELDLNQQKPATSEIEQLRTDMDYIAVRK